MFFGRNFKGKTTCFGFFFSLLSIQLAPPLESHVQDSHGRKTDWKAKKSIHPEEVLTIFNGLHSSVMFLFQDWWDN